MKHWLNQRCQACQPGTAMARQAAEQGVAELAGWQLLDIEGVLRLRKSYAFANFADALTFTNQVGALAEQEGHHPDILTRWGQVELVWYTHKVQGLHVNDFICAAHCEQLFERFGQ